MLSLLLVMSLLLVKTIGLGVGVSVGVGVVHCDIGVVVVKKLKQDGPPGQWSVQQIHQLVYRSQRIDYRIKHR